MDWLHRGRRQVAKAHKQVKVAQEDQGYSLFAVIDEHGRRRWLRYATCHFGCSWTAYWWSRAAACFVRIGHRLLQHQHFLAMYVDDLLGLLRRGKAGSDACLPICPAVALGLPLSWRKLRLGTELKWVGWDVSLRVVPRAMLPEDRRERLLAASEPLCQSGAWVLRKELEKCLGLLCWFTTMWHVRLDAGCGSCFVSSQACSGPPAPRCRSASRASTLAYVVRTSAVGDLESCNQCWVA